jgi:hypothetical protein
MGDSIVHPSNRRINRWIDARTYSKYEVVNIKRSLISIDMDGSTPTVEIMVGFGGLDTAADITQSLLVQLECWLGSVSWFQVGFTVDATSSKCQ